ncbi:hypothetical protein BDV33DRAFT_24752 [Aspergillus novoparasiticus]|uniref:Uncharacterized protein n=1 Tax=Aspergillus novoparasiticus TaxID=986946 RepID=A0A5N6F285_9EURO|nr:hypothetical protein BDV33DRAFT_24752 [Aspergillus novoparasiticus]
MISPLFYWGFLFYFYFDLVTIIVILKAYLAGSMENTMLPLFIFIFYFFFTCVCGVCGYGYDVYGVR